MPVYRKSRIFRIFSTLTLLAGASLGFQARAQPLVSQTVVSGLVQPLWCGHAPGDSNRLFIIEQRRGIRIADLNASGTGTLRTTPFLDMTANGLSPYLGAMTLEFGILGMAFHPDYRHNGYFYVTCTPAPSTGTNASWAIVRFHVNPANPEAAEPASAYTIIKIDYSTGNHRSGWISFGPDGYLYATTGDDGEGDPNNNAANKAVLKGKILRIDVDGADNIPGNADDDGFPPSTDNKNYTIPPTNPFIGEAGSQPEIFAYGLRNSWRASFDRATGDLWIGDVGQNAYEEVDRMPAGATGYNFGWKCLEATHPYNGCATPPPNAIPPVFEYPHSGGGVAAGTSVTGGVVYRGCAIPSLRGTYVFGDWGGKCWTGTLVNNQLTNVVSRATELSLSGTTPVHFGEDPLGELYIVSWSTSSGHIRKIKPATVQGPDCNGNGKTDACDIAAGTSMDRNGNGVPDECEGFPCSLDYNHDGDPGTDLDIEDFFACLGGSCCPSCTSADFNGDGDVGPDADIAAFFRVLSGGVC